MLKCSKVKLILIACWLLIFSNVSIAMAVEKLAEYSAFEVMADVASGSTTFFNGRPYLIKLEKTTGGGLNLVSTSLTNNYSDVDRHEFSLNGIVTSGAEYELDTASNKTELFVLLTNYDDSVRKNKNLLLKSSDGKTWKLYKSFPSEWSLDTLEIIGDNISVNCNNCEDTFRVTYVVSSDNDKSWKKHSLPESVDVTSFSGITNDRLFAVSLAKDPEDRSISTYELHYKDIKANNSKWVKTNIKNLLEVSVPLEPEESQEVKNQTYKFAKLVKIFDVADYLIANVKYVSNDGEYRYFGWVSNNNGDHWEFLNFDLNNEFIMQFEKHHDAYHAVTAKKVGFLLDLDDDASAEDEDEDDKISLYNKYQKYKKFYSYKEKDPINMLEVIMSYFAQQKYTYYKVTSEQIASKEKIKPSPKFEFENAIGFNLKYLYNPKATYVDTMLIHSTGDALNLEFVRLHD